MIRSDLNGLSADAIRAYVEECVAAGEVFLYTGGIMGLPLLAEQDWKYVPPEVPTRSLGCTGGCMEGQTFNELMLAHILKERGAK